MARQWRSVWIWTRARNGKTHFYLRWYDDRGRLRAKKVAGGTKDAESERRRHEHALNSGAFRQREPITLKAFFAEHLGFIKASRQPGNKPLWANWRLILHKDLTMLGKNPPCRPVLIPAGDDGEGIAGQHQQEDAERDAPPAAAVAVEPTLVSGGMAALGAFEARQRPAHVVPALGAARTAFAAIAP